jgi:hypothetical protein
MSPPIVYVAITGHGFGHATRTTAVLNEIRQRCPDAVFLVTSTAPHWLLDRQIDGPFIHRPRSLDVGVVQSDSLQMDRAATLEKLNDLQRRSASIIASEVQFLRQNRVTLVLADSPFLAVPIAHAADVPCWMASNFGWDFIYRDWGDDFEAIADWIADYHAQCDVLFRLPFHEPMSAFPNVVDVGLTGSQPRQDLEQLRSQWGIVQPPERTVLMTFGGLGVNNIPYDAVQQFPDWQFITFSSSAPSLQNLIVVKDLTLRPVDFMPLCDRILSKPGYGTFSEACQLKKTVCTLPRDGFAEVPLLLAGIQNYAYHQIIDSVQFFAGEWQFLSASATPPRVSHSLDTGGNVAIATAIVDYLSRA